MLAGATSGSYDHVGHGPPRAHLNKCSISDGNFGLARKFPMSNGNFNVHFGGRPPKPPLPSRTCAMGTTFTDATGLRNALAEWDTNSTGAANTYGPVGDWNVVAVTNLGGESPNFGVFTGLQSFDEDLTGWDTSAADRMDRMFMATASFKNGGQPLVFDTSSVTTMYMRCSRGPPALLLLTNRSSSTRAAWPTWVTCFYP
jgi:hypothetical protein